MKKPSIIRHAFLVCMLIITAGGLLAQTKESKATAGLLAGTWTLDLENSLDNMPAEAKLRYAKLQGAGRQMFIDAYSGRQFTFNADGSYRQQQTSALQVTGRWQLQPDGQTLVITGPGGKTWSPRVEIVSQDKMILHQQNNAGAIMILTDWYLTKNK
jgi:hypothetical protein